MNRLVPLLIVAVVGLGILLLATVRPAAQITIEIQSGKVTQPQQTASPRPSKKLTNQGVIDMAALKLSDDVIIDKIHGTEAVDFDTSVAGLKQLKANNVSDAVVRVMINPHPMMAGTGDATAAKPTNPYVGLGDGIYIVLAGKPIKVQPELYDMYIRGKFTGKIANPHSQLQVSTPLEFVVKGNFFAGPWVIRLDEKGNRREIRFMPRVGIKRGGKVEVQYENNRIFFDTEMIDLNIRRIRVPNLSKGEYGFQCGGFNDLNHNGIQQNYICTFSVLDTPSTISPGAQKPASSALGSSASSVNALSGENQTVNQQSQNVAALLGLEVTTSERGGAEIVKIAPGGAADRAALHVGNVINSVDGKRVRSVPELEAALVNRPSGSTVRLGYMFHTNLGWMTGAEKVLTLPN